MSQNRIFFFFATLCCQHEAPFFFLLRETELKELISDEKEKRESFVKSPKNLYLVVI